MSTREIADLLGKQHAHITSSALALEAKGCIALREAKFTNPQNKQTYTEYHLTKRDSIILVAQNSPEFTAAIVDRWQALETLGQSATANLVSIDSMMLNAVDSFKANLIKSVQAAISNAMMPTMTKEDRLIKEGEDLKALAHSLYFNGNQPHDARPVDTESGIKCIVKRPNGAWRMRQTKKLGRVNMTVIDTQRKGDILRATKVLIEQEIKHGLRIQ